MSTILMFRCPDDLLAALDKARAADHRSEFIRRTLGEALGVESGPLPVGLAGASDETRKSVSRLGVQAGKTRSPQKKTKKSVQRNTNGNKGLRQGGGKRKRKLG